MSIPDRFGSLPPDIKTQRERDLLAAGQSRPEQVPHPTPPPGAATVDEIVDRSNRERKAELDQTFAQLKTRAEVDQAFARLGGYARAHFRQQSR